MIIDGWEDFKFKKRYKRKRGKMSEAKLNYISMGAILCFALLAQFGGKRYENIQAIPIEKLIGEIAKRLK